MNILITGATGNVGIEAIKAMNLMEHAFNIYAGIHKQQEIEKYENKNVIPIWFDFMDSRSFTDSISKCDILFLLRPPHISDVKKFFKPLIKACKHFNVKHIVFLSVQGVEKSSIIPHHKIEKLIVESGIPYTFLRPAYFMQNFTTTLRQDIINSNLIFLPAGNAKFTLVDVYDVGLVTAYVLQNISLHINKAYDLTNNEKYSFGEMADLLSLELGRDIQFKSPNLIRFFFRKKREGVPTMFILVMIMLHYFPRFQEEPPLSKSLETITSKQPVTFSEFIQRHKQLLSG
jgi:nucleoside-diphosphate-sugar epimerase